MLSLIPLVAAFAPAADLVKSHDDANPLYRELRETGSAVSATEKAKLPAPSMADGLDAAAQQQVLKQIAEGNYDLEEFTRQSVVAPFVLKIRDVKPSDPEAPARGVDLWFVVYGDLNKDVGGAFVERALGEGRKGDQAREVTSEELAKRGIKLEKQEPQRESFGNVKFTFLDRVELQATGRTYWTRTADSFLAAARLDPRFENDKEFPNRWRSIEKDGDAVKHGPWSPYSGSAQYLKVTRLAEPKGALLVEYHLIFSEPAGWFDGANFLRSKLPPAAQQIVRSMRRELLKDQKK